MRDTTDGNGGRGTAGPFLGALVIIVAVVIGVWLLNVFSSDELADDQQIALAVVAQNDALQRQDYGDFRAYTCTDEQGVEADIIAAQRNSAAQRGERFVDGTTVVEIDGDRATADVTYHFAKDPDAKETVEMSFARQDGAWKVCSTGPE